jgi:hypothetical protein
MDFGIPALKGAPFPRLPFGLHSDGTTNPDGTFVTVWLFGHPELELCGLPLIDVGPGKKATKDPEEPHALDLTRAAFVKLAAFIGIKPKDAIKKGKLRVGFKVVAA